MKAKNVATPKNIVASRCFDCCPHGAFFELPTFITYSSLYVWLVQSTRYVKHTLTRHHSGLTKLFSTLKEAWLLSCRDTYILLFSMTSCTNMWYFFSMCGQCIQICSFDCIVRVYPHFCLHEKHSQKWSAAHLTLHHFSF